MSQVTLSQRTGLIDKTGTAIIPAKLNSIQAFGNMLEVEMNGKMALLNLSVYRYVWEEDGFGK
jgi:hypothetical protein